MRLYHASAFDVSQSPDSHWRATAPPLGRPLAKLTGAAKAEVAVIGAGYTGLHAALALARDHGMDVAVVEAGEPGWGASGRNGGFCSMGSAKLGYHEMIARFGLEETKAFEAAQRAAVEHVAEFLDAYGIDAERAGKGVVQLAHKPNRVQGLIEEREFLRSTLGIEREVLDRAQLASRGMAGPLFHAGLANPVGFGLHPLKYLRGLARAALDAGVRVFSNSPAIGWHQASGRHVLDVPGGELAAGKVLVATNGYSDDGIPPAIAGRLLPALSNIIVTRPLTPAELSAQGWTTHDIAYDTRTLLHYFRLLPCGRFLFGGRGGTDAAPEALSSVQHRLRRTFEAMFPAWSNVETERSWSGFVCLARDRTPYAGPLEGMENVWLSAAYHGSGVAMASYAGARLAEVIAGHTPLASALPTVMTRPLRPFPLPGLRRYYLKAAYAGFSVRDEWL